MRSIVINREFGSGGREIGKRLSRELNMPFYDSNILLHAAERYGINPDVIKDCDEKLIVGMRYNFAAFVTQNGEAMKLPYKMYEAIAEKELDTIMEKVRVTLKLAPEDFDYYTVYDNSTYCKPNLNYYLEILEKTGLKAEECLMVGNDVSEDMITETLGMKVFLLTNCLINKGNEDISKYPHGGFQELKEYLKNL